MSHSYQIDVPNASKSASLLVDQAGITFDTMGNYVLIIDKDIRYSVAGNIDNMTLGSWTEKVESNSDDASSYQGDESRWQIDTSYAHDVGGDEEIQINHTNMDLNLGPLMISADEIERTSSKTNFMIFGAMNTNVGNELTISGSKFSFTIRIGLEVALTSNNTYSMAWPFSLAFSYNKSDKTVFMGETNLTALAVLDVKIFAKKEGDKVNKNEYFAGNILEITAGVDISIINNMNKANSLTLEIGALKQKQANLEQFMGMADISVAAKHSGKYLFSSRM